VYGRYDRIGLRMARMRAKALQVKASAHRGGSVDGVDAPS